MRRWRASTRSAPARPPPPRAASAPCSRRCGAPARTCRRSCARRSTPRCGPKPDERGTLDELAAELAESLPEVSDDGGTVAPHPLERTEPFGSLPRGVDRAVGAALAGGLVAAALAWAGQPLLGALAAVAAVAIFPRVGWLAVTVATVAMLSTDRAGAAVLVVAAVVPVPLLLRRRGVAWSVPALAPLLGLAGLAGAYPAIAGRARGPLTRVALGALGAWWALLAAPLLGRELLGGGGTAAAVLSDPSTLGDALTDTEPALNDVIGPLLTSGALLYAVAVGARGAPAALAGAWPLARRRPRRGVDLGRGPRRRNRRDRPVDRRSRASGLVLGARRGGRDRRRGTTPPGGTDGGAVTPGRILCTGNHGHMSG